jgi:hypothetical protein
MTPTGSGMQSIYEQWLGTLPQFFGQFGASPPSIGAGNGSARALPFPVDQVAKAAQMTQSALQGLAQSYAPLLQSAGAPALIAQWANAMPLMASMMPTSTSAPSTPSAAFAPWTMAMPMPGAAAATPQPASANAFAAGAQAALLPFSQLQRAWLDMSTKLTGGTTDTYVTAFERTYGALSDALGLGPMRKLQAALGQLMSTAAAQNDARARYAMLVQSAFSSGFDEMMRRLADMAQRGERMTSMLALMKLWASATEDAVHKVLQSEPGLAATAEVTRAGLTYRKQLKAVSAILADMLDMASRRDLDEAFREIQQLKRELRNARAETSRANAHKASADHSSTSHARAKRAKKS